jgi:hypothetical protein
VQWHFIEYAFRRRNRICGAVPAGECITAKIDEYAQRLGEGNYVQMGAARRGGQALLSRALLMENRNGLLVNKQLTQASGRAEREAALETMAQLPGRRPVTLGGDKAYDTAAVVL